MKTLPKTCSFSSYITLPFAEHSFQENQFHKAHLILWQIAQNVPPPARNPSVDTIKRHRIFFNLIPICVHKIKFIWKLHSPKGGASSSCRVVQNQKSYALLRSIGTHSEKRKTREHIRIIAVIILSECVIKLYISFIVVAFSSEETYLLLPLAYNNKTYNIQMAASQFEAYTLHKCYLKRKETSTKVYLDGKTNSESAFCQSSSYFSSTN